MSELQQLQTAHPGLFNKENWTHTSEFGVIDEETGELGYVFRFNSPAEIRRFRLYMFNNKIEEFQGYPLVVREV